MNRAIDALPVMDLAVCSHSRQDWMNFPKLTTSAPKDPGGLSNSNINRGFNSQLEGRGNLTLSFLDRKGNLYLLKISKRPFCNTRHNSENVNYVLKIYFLGNKLLNCWGGWGVGLMRWLNLYVCSFSRNLSTVNR
jgi:hypothetical protein